MMMMKMTAERGGNSSWSPEARKGQGGEGKNIIVNMYEFHWDCVIFPLLVLILTIWIRLNRAREKVKNQEWGALHFFFWFIFVLCLTEDCGFLLTSHGTLLYWEHEWEFDWVVNCVAHKLLGCLQVKAYKSTRPNTMRWSRQTLVW